MVNSIKVITLQHRGGKVLIVVTVMHFSLLYDTFVGKPVGFGAAGH
jgi:hypothetical protein